MPAHLISCSESQSAGLGEPENILKIFMASPLRPARLMHRQKLGMWSSPICMQSPKKL